MLGFCWCKKTQKCVLCQSINSELDSEDGGERRSQRDGVKLLKAKRNTPRTVKHWCLLLYNSPLVEMFYFRFHTLCVREPENTGRKICRRTLCTNDLYLCDRDAREWWLTSAKIFFCHWARRLGYFQGWFFTLREYVCVERTLSKVWLKC